MINWLSWKTKNTMSLKPGFAEQCTDANLALGPLGKCIQSWWLHARSLLHICWPGCVEVIDDDKRGKSGCIRFDFGYWSKRSRCSYLPIEMNWFAHVKNANVWEDKKWSIESERETKTNLPCEASCTCLMVRNLGRSSPAMISFWVILRSGDDFCRGTSAIGRVACGGRGASIIGEMSSEHCESHSAFRETRRRKIKINFSF